MGVGAHSRRATDRRSSRQIKEVKMEPYTSVVVVLSVALLLIASGLAKQQLVWKRPRPLPIRSRRRKP
jgi:hypothetical protein